MSWSHLPCSHRTSGSPPRSAHPTAGSCTPFRACASRDISPARACYDRRHSSVSASIWGFAACEPMVFSHSQDKHVNMHTSYDGHDTRWDSADHLQHTQHDATHGPQGRRGKASWPYEPSPQHAAFAIGGFPFSQRRSAPVMCARLLVRQIASLFYNLNIPMSVTRKHTNQWMFEWSTLSKKSPTRMVQSDFDREPVKGLLFKALLTPRRHNVTSDANTSAQLYILYVSVGNSGTDSHSVLTGKSCRPAPTPHCTSCPSRRSCYGYAH